MKRLACPSKEPTDFYLTDNRKPLLIFKSRILIHMMRLKESRYMQT